MKTDNPCLSCFHYKICVHRHGKCRDFITWEMIEKDHDKFVNINQRVEQSALLYKDKIYVKEKPE